MKNVFKLLLVLLTVVEGTMMFAQAPATLLVNGALTPTQVPDEIGYRAVLIYMDDPNDALPVATRVAMVALPTVQDVSTFTTAVQAFYPAYEAASPQSAKDAIVQSYITSLNSSLSAAGVTALYNYVQAQKSNIQVWGQVVNGNTQVGFTTYTNATAQDVGDPDSYYDDYGDEEGGATGDPEWHCNYIPVGSDLFFNATTWEGGNSVTADINNQ